MQVDFITLFNDNDPDDDLAFNCPCDRFANCSLKDTLDICNCSVKWLHRYYIHANQVIRRSGMYNYEFCKFPVPCSWDLDKFESLLTGYDDKEIITFLRYGWPIDTSQIMLQESILPNQKGARDSPNDIQEYINKELANNSIIGPFNSVPFGQKSCISPIDAIPKKDSLEEDYPQFISTRWHFCQ